MHFILGAIAAAATVFFYIRIISRGASEAADAAQTLANIPRRRRFAKAARTSGYNLLQDPLEAAIGLMVSVANLGQPRSISDEERRVILSILTSDMEQDSEDAEDSLTQIEALLYDRIEPRDSVAPCVRILHPALSRADAEQLASNLDKIAAVGGATSHQIRMVADFRDRMGLL